MLIVNLLHVPPPYVNSFFMYKPNFIMLKNMQYSYILIESRPFQNGIFDLHKGLYQTNMAYVCSGFTYMYMSMGFAASGQPFE